LEAFLLFMDTLWWWVVESRWGRWVRWAKYLLLPFIFGSICFITWNQ